MSRRKKDTHMQYLFSEDIQYVRGRKKKRSHWKKVLVVLLVLVLLGVSVFSIRSIAQTYGQMFGRVERPVDTIYLTYEDVAEDCPRQEITFPSDENTLQGYLYGPEEAEAIVVLSHGLGSGADDYLADIVYFVHKGFKVFAYDNTGCYDSEGKGVRGLSQSVIDLDAALTWLERQEAYEDLPVLLYGHSWGGYAVCAILGYDHAITAAVSVSAYNSPMEMIREWCEDNIGPQLTWLETPYIWLYQKILFGGASNISAAEAIEESQVPVMVIHGTRDGTVSYDGASIIAHREEIESPKVRFVTCSEAGRNGHSNLFFSQDALDYAAELRAEYMEQERIYGSNMPEDVSDAWYADVDRARTSERDEVFMQDVYDFYEEALTGEAPDEAQGEAQTETEGEAQDEEQSEVR